MNLAIYFEVTIHKDGDNEQWSLEMAPHCSGATRIVERVYSLREPFQQNAVDWLRARTQRALVDLPVDLDRFLNEQDSFVRDFFIKHTLAVLDAAVTHFGNDNTPPDKDFRGKFTSEASSASTPATRFDVSTRQQANKERISARLAKA